MTRIYESRLNTRRNVKTLVVFNWCSERFQLSNVSFFEERLERRLLLALEFAVLSFQIGLLQ